MFLRGWGGCVVHVSYKVAPPPFAWTECHEFSRLVALVRKMANKRVSLPPSFYVSSPPPHLSGPPSQRIISFYGKKM